MLRFSWLRRGLRLCSNNCTVPFFNDPKALPAYEFLREMMAYTPPGLAFVTD